jgi:integrase
MSKERRPKGEGSFHTRADGWVRGSKQIDGQRVYTKWRKTKHLASQDLKAVKPKLESHTVRDAIDGYMQVKSIAITTRAGYQHSGDHYLKPLHKFNCQALTYKQVADFYKSMSQRGLALSTIRQAHAVLSGTLAFALNSGWVDQNVASFVKLPSAPRKKVEGFRPSDRAAVLAQSQGHRFEARYRLSLVWGLRPGEAIGLRWQDIDFEAGTVRVGGQIQRSKVKIGTESLGIVFRDSQKSEAGARKLWPDKETMAALEATRDRQAEEMYGRALTAKQIALRKQRVDRIAQAKKLGLFDHAELYSAPPDDLVFTLQNGDPLLPDYDAQVWTQLLRAAEVPHNRRYAARHTAVNHLLTSGAPLASVSTAMGHASQSFTQRVYGGSLDVLSDGLADYL